MRPQWCRCIPPGTPAHFSQMQCQWFRTQVPPPNAAHLQWCPCTPIDHPERHLRWALRPHPLRVGFGHHLGTHPCAPPHCLRVRRLLLPRPLTTFSPLLLQIRHRFQFRKGLRLTLRVWWRWFVVVIVVMIVMVRIQWLSQMMMMLEAALRQALMSLTGVIALHQSSIPSLTPLAFCHPIHCCASGSESIHLRLLMCGSASSAPALPPGKVAGTCAGSQ